MSHDLSRIVAKHDLLRHPFYQAWSEGTLPPDTLAHYAAEYGAFIGTIPSAWRALGETEVAASEEGHAGLWEDFARSVGARVHEPTVPAVRELCATLDRMTGSADAAIGALYAFEGQQPRIARSKLDGLEQHYRATWPAVSVEYFRAHLEDYAEPALLEARFEALEPTSRERARAAAETMGQALWAALDGILECRSAGG